MTQVLRRAIVLAALVVLATPTPGRAESLTGIPKVIDGDTIQIGRQTIRLYGIDAPDERQTCELDGHSWGCGRDAAFALSYVVGKHWVTCTRRGQRGEIMVATCRAGPLDLAEHMVRAGFALAERGVTAAYTVAEADARRARAGLWKSQFVKPWDWSPPAGETSP